MGLLNLFKKVRNTRFTVIKVVETTMYKTDQVVLEVYVSKVEDITSNDTTITLTGLSITDLLIYPENEFNVNRFVALNKSQEIFEVDLNRFKSIVDYIEDVGQKEVYHHPNVKI